MLFRSLTCLTAYPLSLSNFYGKNVILFYYSVTMFFSGGIIPTYLIIRDLKLLDTIWAVVLPSALGMWNIIMVRTNFKTIPESIIESACIDGASHWRILFQIVIPLSKAILAVILMFSMVQLWNDYINPMLYLSTSSKLPLQVVLRSLVMARKEATSMQGVMAANANVDPFGLRQKVKMAAIVVSIGPIVMMYPFLQKYFVKGVMIGAIKS